jgi:PPM family protein phosphatase
MSDDQALDLKTQQPPAEKQVTDRVVTEELIAGWEGLQPTCYVRLLVGAKTDLGSVRENNEDKFDLLEPQPSGKHAFKGRFYGVADGMGGHSAGQIASELALKTVIHAYYADAATGIVNSLNYAISEANGLIYDTAQMIPDRRDMGTTLTCGVVYEDRLTIAHTGDSRAYLIRDDKIEQITRDHSWVAEQVSLGALTIEQAQMSPFRNIITRSIGTQPTVEPDFYAIDLLEGDRILMCSDGLTAHLEATDILRLAGNQPALEAGPSMTAMKLIEVANARGGRDNITVLILDITAIERVERPGDKVTSDGEPEPKPKAESIQELENDTPDARSTARGWSLFGSVR